VGIHDTKTAPTLTRRGQEYAYERSIVQSAAKEDAEKGKGRQYDAGFARRIPLRLLF